MRIIVTGGRDYADRMAVELTLITAAKDSTTRPTLVHGGARGADALAANVALRLGWWVEEFPADWTRLARYAGPERNQRMIDAGADLLIAFPGGSGTKDCTRRARAAGIPVREVQ